MFYKVIQYFGPNHPDWKAFAAKHWIQPLLSFDSIDGILAPDLFVPTSAEDWSHCVNQDFKTSFITDLEYARKVQQSLPDSRLIGVKENASCDKQQGLLGYDILDEHNHVSVLTNWGPHEADHPLARFRVGSNGLIGTYAVAGEAASHLRKEYSAEDHATGATVWAVFSLDF